MRRWWTFAVGALLSAVAACSSFTGTPPEDVDAGPDAGVSPVDAGTPPVDGATPDADVEAGDAAAPVPACSEFGAQLEPTGWAILTIGGGSMTASDVDGGVSFDQAKLTAEGQTATLSRAVAASASGALDITALLEVNAAAAPSKTWRANIVTLECAGAGPELIVSFEVGSDGSGPGTPILHATWNGDATPILLGGITDVSYQTLELKLANGVLDVAWGTMGGTFMVADAISSATSCRLSVGAVASGPLASVTAQIQRVCVTP